MKEIGYEVPILALWRTLFSPGQLPQKSHRIACPPPPQIYTAGCSMSQSGTGDRRVWDQDPWSDGPRHRPRDVRAAPVLTGRRGNGAARSPLGQGTLVRLL